MHKKGYTSSVLHRQHDSVKMDMVSQVYQPSLRRSRLRTKLLVWPLPSTCVLLFYLFEPCALLPVSYLRFHPMLQATLPLAMFCTTITAPHLTTRTAASGTMKIAPVTSRSPAPCPQVNSNQSTTLLRAGRNQDHGLVGFTVILVICLASSFTKNL